MKHVSMLRGMASVIVVAVILLGCAQNPEENPVIKEALDQIKVNTESLQANSDLVRGISQDINAIHDEISALKKQVVESADGGKKITDMEKRIAAVEASINDLKKTAVAVKSVSASPKSESKKSIIKEETLTEAKGYYYTIKKGDTLNSIAKDAGVSVSRIFTENDLKADSVIYPGNKIFIPYSGKK